MKDTIPAPIVLAIAGGGVPLVKALLDGANLAIAVGIAIFLAALCYFVSLYLLGKMGLPATASLLDVSAAEEGESKAPLKARNAKPANFKPRLPAVVTA